MTAFSGGYVSSGAVRSFPIAIKPEGFYTSKDEEFGEVQTPFKFNTKKIQLKLGDPIFCRFGKAGEPYYYYFNSTDPDNNPVSFYVDWGDGNINEWNIEGASGESEWVKHTFIGRGTYTIKAKARDTLGEESDWGTLTVTMPRYKSVNFNSWFQWFQVRYPLLFPILRQLLDL